MGRKIGEILIVLGMIFLLNVLGSRAEEKVQMYQIYCEEPNGEKGYYTKSVKVEIEHLDQECITKFQLNFPDGKELTGKLEKAKEKIVLEESLFEKGNYHLIIWMENKEGKWWKAPSRNGKSRSIRRHRQTRFLFNIRNMMVKNRLFQMRR